MSGNKRVEHQRCSDQELIDLYGQFKDRDAVVELYERYRVSIGNYLLRDIKDKEVVADTFNTMMLCLVTSSSSQACGRAVLIKLFAMAYKYRLEYVSRKGQESVIHGASTSIQENIKPMSKLARLRRDVIELLYKHNFTFDEVAEIIGCTTSAVKSCLSYIRNQYQPLFGSSNTSIIAIEDYVNHAEARC